MNDEEIDRCVASAFRVQAVGSDAFQARLQSLHQDHLTKVRRIKLVPRVVCGFAITLTLVTCLLVYPRVTRPVNAAASVYQALAKVNTWHLTGWKLQDGHQVAWEVWGRRKPFFYREQIGSSIVLDDGIQRLSIYGPRPGIQSGGICLIHPSLRDDDNVPWSYTRMVLQWRDAGKPGQRTAKGPVFNFNACNMDGLGVNTDHLYFVDGGTWLPTRYEKRTYPADHEKSRHAVEVLDAEYDVSIPASASAAVAPPGYRTFDAMKTPDRVPREGTVSANGLTLHCQPLAMDKLGNVLVQLRGWLGSTIVPSSGVGDVHFQVDTQRWLSERAMDPPVNHDNQGRAYVGVHWSALDEGNPDPNTYLMLFVPLEPLPGGSAPPKLLTASFDATVFAGWGAPNMLVREKMTLSTSLPQIGPPIAVAIGHFGKFDGRQHSIRYGGYENLMTAIYSYRARNYGPIVDFLKPDAPEMHRYIYWREQAIASGVSMDVQLDRIYLAHIYKSLGNATRSRRLLLDVLHEKRFLKPQALPVDRSPAGYADAEKQVRQWNQRYFGEAREMLRKIDKSGAKTSGKR